MPRKTLHPDVLRPFNFTHAKDAVGDYGEQVISRLVGAVLRDPKKQRPHLPPIRSGKRIAGADLSIPEMNTEIEVKMRQNTQAVYVGLTQQQQMRNREQEQYYSLAFYTTRTMKRVGEICPIGQHMTEYDIKKAQSALVRQVQIRTILLFPSVVVCDYFAQRDEEGRTRKYGGSVWSSNIGPIKEYFEAANRNDKASLELLGFSPSRPNMHLHIIGDEMIERVHKVQEETGMLLGCS